MPHIFSIAINCFAYLAATFALGSIVGQYIKFRREGDKLWHDLNRRDDDDDE